MFELQWVWAWDSNSSSIASCLRNVSWAFVLAFGTMSVKTYVCYLQSALNISDFLPGLFWNHVAWTDVTRSFFPSYWSELLLLLDCRFWFVKMALGVHVAITRWEIFVWGRDYCLYATWRLWSQSKNTCKCKAWYLQVLIITYLSFCLLFHNPPVCTPNLLVCHLRTIISGFIFMKT